MLFCMMEHHCQNERAGVLLEGHPFLGEHNSGPAIDLYHVVIIVHQFLHLLAGAEGNGLIGLDLIE